MVDFTFQAASIISLVRLVRVVKKIKVGVYFYLQISVNQVRRVKQRRVIRIKFTFKSASIMMSKPYSSKDCLSYNEE